MTYRPFDQIPPLKPKAVQARDFGSPTGENLTSVQLSFSVRTDFDVADIDVEGWEVFSLDVLELLQDVVLEDGERHVGLKVLSPLE